MSGVVDPQQEPVLEPDPGRALDLNEQRVDRIPDPANLEMAAVERAVLDLGPVEISRDDPVTDEPLPAGVEGRRMGRRGRGGAR